MNEKIRPLIILQGITSLTNINLEKNLANLKKSLNPNIALNQWDNYDTKDGIFFDLSQIRFSNLSAVTQLALLVESAVRYDLQVFIALPTKRNTITEQQSTHLTYELKSEFKEKRTKANNFLKNVGFIEATKCEHINPKKKVQFTEEYDFETKFNPVSFSGAFKKVITKKSAHEKQNYKYLYPLEWLNCKKDNDPLKDVGEKLERILLNEERGIDKIDFQGIKNVVLSELVKNVREHSKVEYAIFSIGLIDTKSLFIPGEEKELFSSKIETNYIKWLIKENIQSQVEIYFGDSGQGIFSDTYNKAFSKANINKTATTETLLEWVFDKWSTSKTEELIRGTKGLYRINRIVNKYNGIFHIRTKNVDGGYQKGGFQTQEWLPFRKRSVKCVLI